MGKIDERMYARCPFGKAPSYLQFYLDELAARSSGARGTLRLTLSTADLRLPGGVAVSHDVIVHFTPVSEVKYGTQITAVEWQPAGGGPFPTFSGTIAVEADENYDSCALVVDGDYDPPYGALGQAFDAALGARIASATARELLRELKGVLEESYAREQALAGAPLPKSTI
ncbi:MAG TPA: hypothetical protein VEJ20_07695 [Candidatus Eremiobacteraceae bacterium]|nr:hypothetical protein [Candidatus Eremiobacteraceae bacterium]